MSLKKDTIIDSQGFIALKARVKNEMLRRDGNGPLTAYAGSIYDYNTTPAMDGIVKEEHYDKIRDLMANINPATTTLGAKSAGDIVVAMNDLEGNMTVYESKARGTYASSGNGDCASACTGMCVTQCTTTCVTSCTGSCEGSCSAVCADSCSGGCEGSCKGSCDGSCSGGCLGTCKSKCNWGCDTTCYEAAESYILT